MASESSTTTKNTVQTAADSGYSFGFNTNPSSAVFTPQIDLKNLGFSLPTTGGIFTQTVSSSSNSNRTRTTTNSSTVR